MAWAWGCTPNPGRKGASTKKRSSHHKEPLKYIDKFEKEVKVCQSSATGRDKLKAKSGQILSLMRQLECIVGDSSDHRPLDDSKSNEVHTESVTTKESLAILLAEKDDQIRRLREENDSRYQQIKLLEEHCEQAKQSEIDFRVEAEENQKLRAENEALNNRLDSGFDTEFDGECDEDTTGSHERIVSGMTARIKYLNEDVLKLRNHCKEQSRQILKYKQQVSEMMEGQIESMDRMQHKVKEECVLLQKKLNTTTGELTRIRNEKEVLDKEHAQLERNLISMDDLSTQLTDAKKTITELKQHLADRESEMAAIKVQLAVYKADFDQERQDRIQAHSKMAQMEKESAQYQGQMELDDYEELKHNYQIVNNQLAQHQETLSVVEQVNDTLRQEIQAKSSQVKQYAKEVDRLKRKLESSKSPPHINDETGLKYSQVEELYKTAQQDIQYLSGEKRWHLELIEKLERENEKLRNLLSSTANQNETCIPKYDPPMSKPTVRPSQMAIHPVSPLTGENQSSDGCVVPAVVECDGVHMHSKHVHLPTIHEHQTHPPTQEPFSPTQTKLNHQDCVLMSDQPELDIQPSYLHVTPNAEVSCELGNPIEDSTALFENPLQKELDDEIHQQAAQVIQEVNGNGHEMGTDLQRPFDPNLVCPMCRKQFRIGEIQKFRRHVNTCTGSDDD